MAKRTNNDLLGEILEDLEIIIKDQLKSKKDTKKQDGALSKMLSGPTKELKENKDNTILALNTLKLIIDTVSGAKKISEKDINHVSELVSSLTKVLHDIKFEKEDVESFALFAMTLKMLNEMMTGLNDNLIKYIWKFNPRRGRNLGKTVAGFYKAFFEEFQKQEVFSKMAKLSKDSVDNFISINNIIIQLFQLTAKNVKALGNAFASFPMEAIFNVSKFMLVMIDTINSVPKDSVEYKEKINNFARLMIALSSVPFVQLWIIGKMLNPKDGEKIGNFFKSLVDAINKTSKEKINSASKIVNAIALLMMSLSLSLLIVVLIAKSSIKSIIGGFIILSTLILLSIGIIWVLSKISFEEQKGKVNAKHALISVGAIALLLVALSSVLLITVNIAKNNKIEDIGCGLGILVLLIGATVGMMWILSSNKVLKDANESIWTALAMVALGLVMLEMALIFKWVAGGATEIAIGGVVMMGLTLAMVGVIWVASKIGKGNILKEGLLGIAAIAGSLIILRFAVSYYMDLMEKIGGITGEDIAKGSGIVLLIIAGTTAAIFAASLCLSGPLAIFFEFGMAGVLLISLALGVISAAVGSFVELISKINKDLTLTAVNNAFNMINGDNGMANCILEMIKTLNSIDGVRHAKRIAKKLIPLFKMIGKFMKIIDQMANLKYIESYDKNGNPIYAKMPTDVFKSAASILAQGFAEFINTLGKSFNDKSENIKTVRQICKQLTPNRRLFRKKTSIADLLKALGTFVNIIEKMSTLKYITGYKDDGTPIYEKMPDDAFTKAANIITKGFTSFLNELNINFKWSHANIESIIDDLSDGDIKDLFTSIGQFLSIVEQSASMKYISGFKEDGSPIYEKMEEALFKQAAINIYSAFHTFLSELLKGFLFSSDLIEDIIDDISDGDTKDLFNVIGMFMDTLVKTADLKIAKYDTTGKIIGYEYIDMVKASSKLSDAFISFFSNLNNNLHPITKTLYGVLDIILGTKNQYGLIDIFDKIGEFINPCIEISYGKYKGREFSIIKTQQAAYDIGLVVTKLMLGLPTIELYNKMITYDQTKSFGKVINKYIDVIYEMASMTKKIKNKIKMSLPEFGVQIHEFSMHLIEAVYKLSDIPSNIFYKKVYMLNMGTDLLETAINRIKKIDNNTSLYSMSYKINRICNSISNFMLAISKHLSLEIKARIEIINENTVNQLIETLTVEEQAFTSVEESIKRTNDQMQRLIDLEKEWQQLSNDSIFNKMASMMQNLAKAFNDALNAFTDKVGEEYTLKVSIDPQTIAAGIETAGWSYVKLNDITYVKS